MAAVAQTQGSAAHAGAGAGLEARRGAHRDLRDRHRLLDGLSPERLDPDLLGRRQHRLERLRNDLELHQSVLGRHPHVSAGLVLGMSGQRGKEPATPTKMAIGMTLTGLSFFISCSPRDSGETYDAATNLCTRPGSFRIKERTLDNLRAAGVPERRSCQN